MSTQITVEGYSFIQQKGVDYMRGWRVYGTDRVHIFDDGERSPLPNTWRLIRDVKFNRHARRLTWPDISLEPTVDSGDGIKLYAGVFVDAEGRERWQHAEYMILPLSWWPSISVAEWMLENMGLRGEIVYP
ncbi:MAG: hypothetical protein H0W99_06800 [Acidobacteria bacterium]|nr:hypothetical protein [Acidobacteriota bacterium]